MSNPLTNLHPLRSANIQGVTAEALSYMASPKKRRPLEMMSVKTAEDAAIALGDDGNEHHCPLCNDFFTTKGFVAHARRCIEARVPRKFLWTPPGFSTNAIQSYTEERPLEPGGLFS